MTEENKECKCCECREKLVQGLKEFTFKALIVYVGVTLAIITSANVLKPKHPCHKMMPPRAGIVKQMPEAGFKGAKTPGDMKGYHLEYQYGRRAHSRFGKKQLRPTWVPNEPQKAEPVKK